MKWDTDPGLQPKPKTKEKENNIEERFSLCLDRTGTDQ